MRIGIYRGGGPGLHPLHNILMDPTGGFFALTNMCRGRGLGQRQGRFRCCINGGGGGGGESSASVAKLSKGF